MRAACISFRASKLGRQPTFWIKKQIVLNAVNASKGLM